MGESEKEWTRRRETKRRWRSTGTLCPPLCRNKWRCVLSYNKNPKPFFLPPLPIPRLSSGLLRRDERVWREEEDTRLSICIHTRRRRRAGKDRAGRNEPGGRGKRDGVRVTIIPEADGRKDRASYIYWQIIIGLGPSDFVFAVYITNKTAVYIFYMCTNKTNNNNGVPEKKKKKSEMAWTVIIVLPSPECKVFHTLENL